MKRGYPIDAYGVGNRLPTDGHGVPIRSGSNSPMQYYGSSDGSSPPGPVHDWSAHQNPTQPRDNNRQSAHSQPHRVLVSKSDSSDSKLNNGIPWQFTGNTLSKAPAVVPNVEWCDGCGSKLPLQQPAAPWHEAARRRINSRNISPNDPHPPPKAHYADSRLKESFERIMHAQVRSAATVDLGQSLH